MPEPAAVPLETFLDTVANPPAAFRPAPFFVLNDEYEGEAGEPRVTQVLEQYARLGYGGAFLHPRPGLITPYLSDRWFAIVRHAVKECRRLGLVPYLYDENSYPSGVGGGHVPAMAPEARTRVVSPTFGDDPAAIPPRPVALHRWDEAGPGPIVAPGDLRPGDRWVAFSFGDMSPLAWHGETACPSLLHPRTAEAFLQSTHEAYRRELGDLWADVPAIFTDEPHLPAQGHGPWATGLHLSPWILGQFRQRRGYDLRACLTSLWFDTGDFHAVRFDLYDLMHELWVEHWARPLEDWCDTNRIALTGHYLEHDWPSPYATPGHVHMLAHMHWPGTDMLEGFLLSGHEEPDIQNFFPAPDGQEPHGLYYLRQVHAVVNQLGKERNLDECWGAGGHDSTPADWARIGRWLVIHGVNLLNPHLSFTTIRGPRKADHPQTFSDHSPWFDFLKPLNDELSRLAWACSQGEIHQRVLLLDPLANGYVMSRKGYALPPALQGESGHSAAAPPDAGTFQHSLASVLGIQREQGKLAQALSDAQVDFDPGDEYVLEEFGRVDGNRLAIGEQAYEVVIWPGCLTNLRSATVGMLREFFGNGGHVMGVRPERLTVDGRPSDVLAEFDAKCQWLPDREALVAAVRETALPRLEVDTPPPTGLAHMRRVLAWGEVFAVVNSSGVAVDSAVVIETARSSLAALDPISGDLHALPAARDGDRLRSRLRVGPRGAVVLLATDEVIATTPAPAPLVITGNGTPLELTAIERAAPNVLVIDTCELTLGDETFPREAVYAANHRFWQAHGFETNGWMAVIQYRDQLLAMNRHMSPESGGTVTYRFELDAGVDPAGIRLAIETPELWTVSVNGTPVAFTPGETWLDVHIGVAEVGGHLRPGENAIMLEGWPFDVRREIDQVYLLGEFGCEASDPGFRIVPPTPPALGSWREQGLPFHDREMVYTFALPEGGPGVLALDSGDWAGSYLLVEQAGTVVAQLMEPPYAVRLDPANGPEMTLRVIGLPKNLLGPFHAPGQPRKRAWTPMWYGPSVPTTPQPGSAYDLLDLGLLRAPRWHGGK